MKRVVLFCALAACGHGKAADPGAAPSPWPAATTPPPAREPAQAPVAHPDPTRPPAAVARPPSDREIPAEGEPRPFVLPKPERAKLACGAELLLVKRTRLPIATLLVVWPHGASGDPQAEAGLAALTANLLTEGAGTRTSLEVAAEAERLGARLASEASWDATTISLTMLTRQLQPSLALLADVALRPRFDQDELERVRNEARTRLRQLGDQASTQAALVGARSVYGKDHRYGELAQGSRAGLSTITRDDVVAWHHERLPIGRATIIAVGDLDLASLRTRLDALLGKTHGPLPKLVRTDRHELPALQRQIVVVDRPGAAQTEIRAYEPGPPRSSPEYFALTVLNTIFGGNFSSRLNGKLREEKGYTYGARSEFAFRRDGGPFSAGAPVKTAVTKAALVDFLAELDRLRGGDVDDRELTQAKQTLQRSLARQFETPPQIASSLAALKVFGLPDDYFTTYAARIAAVTPAAITHAAQILHPATMSLVFVGDERVIGADIQAVLGPYTKVTP